MLEWPLVHAASDGWKRSGTVRAVSDRVVHVRAPGLSPGSCVMIAPPHFPPAPAIVVEVSGDGATCVPLTGAQGVGVGVRVQSTLARIGAFVGPALLGHAVDAWGRLSEMDMADACVAITQVADIEHKRLDLSQRAAVSRPFFTGVPAIDAFTTLGYGQRVALFAGAGVGKTTLLRRIVDGAAADARVLALVGERGREAAELVARFRGDRRRSTTTIVCATSEAPAIERIAAVRTATAHAEALADSGLDVLLVVDSLTRVAAAWRELALAAGEPPAQRGHPPSLPNVLARLVERAGARTTGSVTGIYAVLVEGDDEREPVTDAVRALLDGHIALSRKLAECGRFPAVDVLRSLSRLMDDLVEPGHQRAAVAVRGALAALEAAEDLLAIGAYRAGGDPELDAALRVRDDINALVHDSAQKAIAPDPASAIAMLCDIAARLRPAP